MSAIDQIRRMLAPKFANDESQRVLGHVMQMRRDQGPIGQDPVTTTSTIGDKVTPRPLIPMPDDPATQRINALNSSDAYSGGMGDSSLIQGNYGKVVPQVVPDNSLQGRVNTILNKDYSIRKDEQGNVIRGKDRDPKWSLGEKIGGGLVGAFKGLAMGGPFGAIAGAVEGATDRNYFEKMGDQRQLNQLYPRLQMQNEQMNQEQNQQYKQASIENMGEDNRRLQEELLRRSTADQNRNKYYEGILADKARGRELQASQIEDLKTYRQWLIENGGEKNALKIKEIDERIRHNKATEDLQERKFQSQKAREAVRGNSSAPKSPKAKVRSAKEMQDYMKLAQKLDDDFNSGAISEEAYNNMIAEMVRRINQ